MMDAKRIEKMGRLEKLSFERSICADCKVEGESRLCRNNEKFSKRNYFTVFNCDMKNAAAHSKNGNAKVA
jgi:hypothetical protein